MNCLRDEAAQKLMEACTAFYNVQPVQTDENAVDGESSPLLCVCEFFQESEGYVMFRKANIWRVEAEEFMYIYSVPELTEELVLKLRHEAYADGRKRAHIGAGHMCTCVTAVFLCDNCTEKAKKLLKKYSYHETFLLSLHGWLDIRLAMYETSTGEIIVNKAAKDTGAFLERVL